MKLRAVHVALGLVILWCLVWVGSEMWNRTHPASSNTPTTTSTTPQPGEPAPTAPAPDAQPSSGAKLQVKDLVVGKGPEAKTGNAVDVNYTGWLTNGTKFDSNKDHGGAPFTFTLGEGGVIKGWDQGVVGMRVGGKRELTVPPDLGYGAQGTPDGTIPPNATLRFEVELLAVK